MSIITRAGRFAIKHADVIVSAVGTGLTLVGIGLTVASTLDHAEEIKECKKEVELTRQSNLTKSPKEQKKEIANSCKKLAVCMVKTYLPGTICISVGLCSVIFGHKILAKRHLALLAAYESLNQSQKKYRKNIIEDYGKEADICAKHGLKAEKLNDQTIYVPKDDDIFIPDRDLSDAAVFFGAEYSELGSKIPEENLSMLKGQEEYANALFHDQGYLMLQDVYDMLGVNRVAPDGIGWISGRGDNFVDFGIFNVKNGSAVNGDEQVFLLDFNHDGYILPYI